MTKKTLVILVIIICFVIVLDLLYQNMKPSASSENIKVEATLQLSDKTVYPYKDYLIDINIIKSKDCHVIIYPYSHSITGITYNLNEQEDYFIPNTMGRDGVTESVAKTELRKDNLLQDKEEISLYGFWFPDEVGTYKSRMYVDLLDKPNTIDNLVLVCIYIEEKFGKLLTWAKIVPVNLETLDD